MTDPARLLTVLLLLASLPGRAVAQHPNDIDIVAEIRRVADGGSGARSALERLDESWSDAWIPMLVETMRVTGDPGLTARIGRQLHRRTELGIGSDINGWFDWIWKKKIAPHPRYAEVKSMLYSRVDPRFAEYFGVERTTEVRLDEVRWGGVVRDGIPPLRRPAMIPSVEADYLDDDDVVFGIEVAGDVRAYPKRILAWHEMFTDEVGDIHVTGVY